MELLFFNRCQIVFPRSVDKSSHKSLQHGSVFGLKTVTKELNFVDIEPVPQSCSLQRQLDRYMATLPSVNPGTLARASFTDRKTFVRDAEFRSTIHRANTRSILVQHQLCTAVSKPFISQKRLPVDLVFIYVSKYIAGSLLCSLSRFISLPPLLFCFLSFSFSLVRQTGIPVLYARCWRSARSQVPVLEIAWIFRRQVDETKIDAWFFHRQLGRCL